jgi:hypothetical protein
VLPRWPLALAIVFAAPAAFAHGPAGEHDSPAWCGKRLAVTTDTGVLVVDGAAKRAIAIPAGARGLLAWSPGCDRIVVAHQRVAVVEVASGVVRDLGALPAGFQRAIRLDGPLPSIRFTPSGARFALVVAGSTRNLEAVALHDVASGARALLAFPRGEVHAIGMLSEDVAVGAVTPGGYEDPVALFRATVATATRIDSTDYASARVSVAPVAVAAQTKNGDVFVVDGASGSRRLVAQGTNYPRTISADGSHVLCAAPSGITWRVDTAAASPGPPRAEFGIAAGLLEDEELGISPDARAVVGFAGHALVYEAAGTPHVRRVLVDPAAPPAGMPRGGEVSHASLSPDGTQAAFVYEVPGMTARSPGCDWESWGRVELYITPVSASAPTRVQVIGRIHHCAVE